MKTMTRNNKNAMERERFKPEAHEWLIYGLNGVSMRW